MFETWLYCRLPFILSSLSKLGCNGTHRSSYTMHCRQFCCNLDDPVSAHFDNQLPFPLPRNNEMLLNKQNNGFFRLWDPTSLIIWNNQIEIKDCFMWNSMWLKLKTFPLLGYLRSHNQNLSNFMYKISLFWWFF